MRERICPGCGERVTEARARFCPICATALPAEETPAEAATALEEALVQRYSDYNAWVVLTRGREGGGTRILELLTGNSTFKNSEKHEEFFHDIGDKAAALLEAYREAPGSGDIAGLLRYTLIDCHRDTYQETDWLYLVLEQHFLPFTELLSPAEAAGLYEDYKALRKKQKGFPFQAQLLKTLKRRSRA